jgi:hypothetical protein
MTELTETEITEVTEKDFQRGGAEDLFSLVTVTSVRSGH